MRIFVFEHFTAQGIGRDPESREHGLYREGLTMRDALAADFRRIPDTEVSFYPEDSGPVESYTFTDAANAAEWSVVIAPEADDVLAGLAEDVWPTGSRFLGPSTAAIRLTGDKLELAEHWYNNDVRTPVTTDREPSRCEAFPCVWKPREGCGSVATFRLNSALDVPRVRTLREAENHDSPMILQEFVPGRAVSVAFLCGPAGNVPLMPTFQLLSDDGRFEYRGGELPIPVELAERAVRLGKQALDCVSGLLGYVGVDLVLGDADNGSRDYAIEINPRLTTSYVGLRAHADFNIAEAMLQAATGELREPLKWKSGRVRFGADGSITAE